MSCCAALLLLLLLALVLLLSLTASSRPALWLTQWHQRWSGGAPTSDADAVAATMPLTRTRGGSGTAGTAAGTGDAGGGGLRGSAAQLADEQLPSIPTKRPTTPAESASASEANAVDPDAWRRPPEPFDGYFEPRKEDGPEPGEKINKYSPKTLTSHDFAMAKPRLSGRTGNRLFEHVLFRLIAMNANKPFVDHFYPFDAGCFLLRKRVPPSRDGPRDMGWGAIDIGNMSINFYPHDFRLYRRHRGLIRDEILRVRPPPPGHTPPQPFDIVVHVRLEDIQAGGDTIYTYVPLSFFRAALRRMPASAPTTRILVMGRPRAESPEVTRVQERLLMDAARFIQNETRSRFVEIATDNSVEEDFRAILTAKHLIASTSTFWFWPAFMSRTLETVHVPLFGETLTYEFFRDLDERDMAEGGSRPRQYEARTWSDDGSWFHVFGYPLGFDRSVLTLDVEKLYDVPGVPRPPTPAPTWEVMVPGG